MFANYLRVTHESYGVLRSRSSTRILLTRHDETLKGILRIATKVKEDVRGLVVQYTRSQIKVNQSIQV